MTDLSGQQDPQPLILAGFRSREDAEQAVMFLEAEAIPRERIGSRQPEAAPAVAAAPDGPADVQATGNAQPGSGDGDSSDSAEAVKRTGEGPGRVLRTGAAGIAGAMAAAGVVVATGGAAIPAAAAAAAAGLGAGGLSELASKVGGVDTAKAVEEQPEHILVVTPENTDQAERARGIFNKIATIKVWEEPAG